MEFERMNDAYRDKRYPAGSVFVKSAGKNRANSLLLLVLLALAGALVVWGMVYFLSLIGYHRAAGNDEEAKVGLVLLAIFAALLLLCLTGIVFSVKNLRKGVGDLIAASAKASGLTEEDIRAFDRQALQPDSYILRLKGGVSAAMANQSDGILTRDYLWLGDGANRVMRRADIAGACLYQWCYYVKRKRIWCLSVSVVSRQNRMTSAEVSPESGAALLALLRQAQPELPVPQKVLREGKEFDDWRASVAGGVKPQ